MSCWHWWDKIKRHGLRLTMSLGDQIQIDGPCTIQFVSMDGLQIMIRFDAEDQTKILRIGKTDGESRPGRSVNSRAK